MKIGRLCKRIVLQRLPAVTENQNDFGEPDRTPIEVARVWAHYEATRGYEVFETEGVQAIVSGRFLIRYRDGVVPKMKIVMQTAKSTRQFNILAVLNGDPTRETEEKDRELILITTEIV